MDSPGGVREICDTAANLRAAGRGGRARGARCLAGERTGAMAVASDMAAQDGRTMLPRMLPQRKEMARNNVKKPPQAIPLTGVTKIAGAGLEPATPAL